MNAKNTILNVDIIIYIKLSAALTQAACANERKLWTDKKTRGKKQQQ